MALTAQAGLAFRPEIDAINVEGSDAVRAGLGASTKLGEQFGLGAELRTSAPLDKVETAARVPLESIASVRWSGDSGITAMAGGSTGLTPGIGAPAWRAFAGIGFSRAQDRDPDLDALAWVDDDCPYVPERYNGYEDDDGCPEDLGSLLVTATYDGEPVDDAWMELRHGDVVVDVGRGDVGASQLVPDSTWTSEANYACLSGMLATVADGTHQDVEVPMEASLDASLRVEVSDPEGEAIPEALLAWNDSPDGCGPRSPVLDDGAMTTDIGAGAHSFTVLAPGFVPVEAGVFMGRGEERTMHITLRPTQVELTDDRIRLRERIHFAFDKADIKPSSEPILRDLATTLERHPELTLVEIEGHADERGSRAYNNRLSRRRARSVRAWLVGWGIDPDRLSIRARGESDPLVEDDTTAAYALNRRVQFHILQTEDS